MKILYLLFFWFLALANASKGKIGKTLSQCLPIDKAKSIWFNKHKITGLPLHNSCLFYTRRLDKADPSLSLTAQAFAKKNGLFTIWDMWPSEKTPKFGWDHMRFDFYAMHEYSWLRCIYLAGPEYQQRYFAEMSRAYAMNAKGTVYVMTDDPHNIPEHGIWHDHELPILKEHPDVDKIIAINLLGSVQKTIHVRSEIEKEISDAEFKKVLKDSSTLRKREGGDSEEDTEGEGKKPIGDVVRVEPKGQDWFG